MFWHIRDEWDIMDTGERVVAVLGLILVILLGAAIITGCVTISLQQTGVVAWEVWQACIPFVVALGLITLPLFIMFIGFISMCIVAFFEALG